MRRVSIASFGLPESRLGECLQALKDFDRRECIGPVNNRWILHYAMESALIPSFEEIAARYCGRNPDGTVKIGLREECVFSAEELDAAEMLCLLIDRPPGGSLGAPGGEIYDWTIQPKISNPAPWCWQKSPILMRKGKLPRAAVGLHHVPEVIAHRRLSESVPGLSYKHVILRPVSDGESETDWLQVCADRVMPSFRPETTGVLWPPYEHEEDPPPTSPPNVYGTTTEGFWPAYARDRVVERFREIPKMSFTYELFGRWLPGGNRYGPPQPRLLVDQNTRRELMSARVKRLIFVPVRWIE